MSNATEKFIDMNQIIEKLTNIFDKENQLTTEIQQLRNELEQEDKKKYPLAFALHREFMQKTQGQFFAKKRYYMVYLTKSNNNDIVAIKVLYDTSYYPESFTANYAVFLPESGTASRYNLSLDATEENYTASKAIIDEEMFNQLKTNFKIRFEQH